MNRAPLTSYGSQTVLFVMAAQAEYGVQLRKRFEPLMTGVGPVEAALAMGMALANLEREGLLPDMVVSLGSAGSRVLEQTEIYQASSVSYRDMDASALGFEKGATPFLDLPPVVEMQLQMPGIASASLSTGANVVTGDAYEAIDAEMVDMETFAILRACQRFGVPLVALRGISDGAKALQHVDDWTEYLHVIDEKLAYAVDRLREALGDGSLKLDGASF